MDELNRIKIGDYYETVENTDKDRGNPFSNLIRYMVAVTVCSMEELDSYLEMGRGKHFDEIEIPGVKMYALIQ